jgi:ATP-dependent helicase HepA
LQALLAASRASRKEVSAQLEQGRDRLLEWNSFRPEISERLIREIRRQDEDRTLEGFLLSILELFFIEVEAVAPRTYQLGSAGVLAEAFPGLSPEGLTITADRRRALAREDLQFLTWDHPLVTGALDLLLGSERGNCGFARWPDAKVSGFYLEAIYLLECIAPPHLHLDRFLPPTPIRVLVDHRGQEMGGAFPQDALGRLLKAGEGHALVQRPELRERLLPRLLEEAERVAQEKVAARIAEAQGNLHAQLGQEIRRLRELRKVNRSVREEEIRWLTDQQGTMDQHIRGARLRLDALRFIHRGPERPSRRP